MEGSAAKPLRNAGEDSASGSSQESSSQAKRKSIAEFFGKGAAPKKQKSTEPIDLTSFVGERSSDSLGDHDMEMDDYIVASLADAVRTLELSLSTIGLTFE